MTRAVSCVAWQCYNPANSQTLRVRYLYDLLKAEDKSLDS